MKHVKIVFALTFTVLVCVLGVFLVEGPTSKIIEERLRKEAGEAYFVMVPDADDYKSVIKDYDTTDTGITDMVEMTDNNGNVLGVVYNVDASGISSGIKYLLAIDTVENKSIGISVLSHSETKDIGGKLLASNDFLEQYVDVLIEDMANMELDAVADVTLTVGGMQESLDKVMDVHLKEYLNGEIIIEEPERPDPIALDQADLDQVGFENATEFVSVYLDLPEHKKIYNIYEARDASGNVLGHVYYAKTIGNSTIKFLVGIDNENVTKNVVMVQQGETWKDAEDYGNYDGSQGYFPDTTWLDNFENSPISDILVNSVDTISGVTITTTGINNGMEEVFTYHSTNLGGVE